MEVVFLEAKPSMTPPWRCASSRNGRPLAGHSDTYSAKRTLSSPCISSWPVEQLEAENARLKKLLADAELDRAILKEAIDHLGKP